MEKYVNRPEYLDFLKRWQDKQIIKVVSGVRRAGKSTLFELFRNYLLENGVNNSQLININFENMKYDELRDPRKLYEYLESKINAGKMNYIFLDENVLKRELRSLEEIRDSSPKFLLTLDTINREANYNGIQKLNSID